MVVKKKVLKSGNGVDFPKKHDEVAMEYTGMSLIMHFHRDEAASHVS
jgi:hypothetical protein